jgi:hypothetical protein
MAQSNPAAPRVPLTLIPGTRETGPGPEPAPVPLGQDAGTGPGTGAVPVLPAPVPMSVPERLRLAVTRWAGTAAEGAGRLWLHPDRVIHSLWHGKPASMAEHRDYIKSRAWVPKELAGNPAKVIAVAGILYHLLIARPLKVVARTIDAAADRPLRLLMLIVFVLILLHL